MPRALWLCSTIVAAFPLTLLAAPPTTTDVPVTAPVAALAVRLGQATDHDRARFVPEIIRLIYTPPGHRQPTLSLRPAPVQIADRAAMPVVPLPLSPQVWSEAVFKHAIPTEELLAAILADRRAALLCRGLSGLDDATLAFYAEHPQLLAFLYVRGAPAFAAFGASVRVKDGRILVPGGAEAERSWEAAAGASVSAPEAFVR